MEIEIIRSGKNNLVSMKYCTIKGGNQDIVQGVDYTGQLAIHGAKVFLDNVRIENSSSDDGINIKNADVEIKNSYFLLHFWGPHKNRFLGQFLTILGSVGIFRVIPYYFLVIFF